jgi:LemA protein
MSGFIIFFGLFFILIIWGILIRNNIVRYLNATQRA